MSLKTRLCLMNFFQFFVFGAWLVTLSAYAMGTLHFTGTQVGLLYSTVGIAAIFMPALVGSIADRWVGASQVFVFCHGVGALLLFALTQLVTPWSMFFVLLIYLCLYMPTIPLASAICFRVCSDINLDVTKNYPFIRMWGTVGFIAALWLVSFGGYELSAMQLIIAGFASLLLSIFAIMFIPTCAPLPSAKKKISLLSMLGLDALKILRDPKMALFMAMAVLVGVALQVSNTFVSGYLHDFSSNPLYQSSFGVTHSGVVISLGQMSETVCILAIPFILPRFGIKKVMMLSIIAWIIRFAGLAYGDPGSGVWLILLSMLACGAAFDFFNVSCSIYVENENPAEMRASAQGLFFIMTMGIGAFMGSFIGGIVVDLLSNNVGGVVVREWQNIWLAFAGYMVVVAFIVMIFFKPAHNKMTRDTITH